ncbi:MAG: MFS transporter [Acidobacteriota bacterium]
MGASAGYWRLIRDNRNFRLLWLAQIVSEIGDWLYAVVLYDMLLQSTGNASAVATAVVLQVLPQVLVSPVAGVVNDRLSRRTVMILTDIGRCFIIAAMLFVIRGGNLSMIYPLLLLETVMWAFFEPGRSAILPSLVNGERELSTANTLSAVTWSFNLAVGAALGGLLAVAIGRDAVLAINSLSFLGSAWLLWRIRCTESHLEAAPPLRARELVDFRPMVEGFRYIWRDAKLLALMFAKAGIGILGAHHVLLPLYGERIFPIPGEAVLSMSLLMAARGVGALLGPFAAMGWIGENPYRRRLAILAGFGSAAVGYIALSVAPNLWTALAGVIVAHAGMSVIWVVQTLMMQIQTDDRFRGRVFSADFAALILLMALSTHAAGAASDAGAGVRTIALAVGLLALVPAAIWLLFAMPLWRHDPDRVEPLTD